MFITTLLYRLLYLPHIIKIPYLDRLPQLNQDVIVEVDDEDHRSGEEADRGDGDVPRYHQRLIPFT